MEGTLFFILKNLLKKESFKINLDELKFQLLSHPSYPSLHSLTGVLSHFGIDNMALQVPTDLETLMQMPERFISLTKNNQFMVVSRVGDKFEVLLDDKKEEKYDSQNFLEHWSGIVVATEIEESQNDEDKQIDVKRFSRPIYVLAVAAVLLFFFLLNPTRSESIHYFLSVLGVLASVLIVSHELGFSSKTVDKFCGAAESTSCDAVLNSKGASILGFLKLSDLSMMYFLGLLLASFLFKILGIQWSFIMFVSLFAVPVTIYSIYYQYKVVKKWCPLCLGIVGILWLQCASVFISDISFDVENSNFIDMALILFSFLLTSAFWLFLRPLLNSNQEYGKLKVEHYKFKRNFDLFLPMLNKGLRVEPNLPYLGGKEIVLGNVSAAVSLLLITNPQCFYCKSAHTDLEKLLDKHSDEINLRVRFNVNAKDKEDIGSRVCSRILELYATKPKAAFTKAIGDAYAENSDLQKWILDWGEPIDYEAYSAILEEQQEWCISKEVHFTPALFINGKEFPNAYERTDLVYFIEDLAEWTNDISVLEEDTELINQ